LNPNYDVINDVICGFAKVVVERCGFHHWIAQRISWGEVVSVFLYLLLFPSYDVIMSDADCTPGREPHSLAASFTYTSFFPVLYLLYFVFWLMIIVLHLFSGNSSLHLSMNLIQVFLSSSHPFPVRWSSCVDSQLSS